MDHVIFTISSLDFLYYYSYFLYFVSGSMFGGSAAGVGTGAGVGSIGVTGLKLSKLSLSAVRSSASAESVARSQAMIPTYPLSTTYLHKHISVYVCMCVLLLGWRCLMNMMVMAMSVVLRAGPRVALISL